MPVTFDSSRSVAKLIGGGTTSSSQTLIHNVNPSAPPGVFGLVVVELVTDVDLSSTAITATMDGDPLTPFGDPVTWDVGDTSLMQVFRVDSPNGGPHTIVGSVASLPTDGSNVRPFILASATWAGVDEVGEPVIAVGPATTSNSVTVPSVLPAHRVVAIHGTGFGGSRWSAYNQAKRLDASRPATVSVTRLLIGDAPGDDSVTSTVTQISTARWGAWGVSLSPAIVDAGASLTIPTPLTAASGGIYRTAVPAPDRYWLIPAVDSPDNDPGNLSLLRSADGVVMPVYFKDPHDIQDYTLDFSRLLVEDDYIIDATFSPSASSLSVLSSNITDSVQTSRANAAVSVWLSGAVLSVNYGVTCHITTFEGRQHDRTFRVVGGQN